MRPPKAYWVVVGFNVDASTVDTSEIAARVAITIGREFADVLLGDAHTEMVPLYEKPLT